MKRRIVSTLIFIAYAILLIKVMVFKDMPTIRIGHLMLNFGGTDGGHAPNLIPFTTIIPYLLGSKGLIIGGINIVGNIALLVPIGLLTPLVFGNMSWKKCAALAISSGLFIEVMQSILRVGIFDIDDVILNALGVLIGYEVSCILLQWFRNKKYMHICISFLVATLAAIALYAWIIYPISHQVIEPRPNVTQDDPCNGTGGTGKIIAIGNSTVTIQSKKGIDEVIKLTKSTLVKNAAGPIKSTDLKINDSVTVVIDETETASLVLVCR